MAYAVKQDICSGCHTCELFCPADAFRMKNSKYWIDPEKCVSCGTCAKHCHNAAIYDQEAKPVPAPKHEKIVKECDILVIGGGGSFAMGTQLSHQPKGINYTIFDVGMAKKIKDEMNSGDAPPSFFGPMKLGDDFLEEIDRVAATPNGGVLVRGETIEELAANAGINAENLKATIAHYNEMCQAGEDAELFKPADQLLPFTGGPYYAVQGHLSHDGAFGGVKINANTQAYKPDGSVIENLFVPGDFASGRFTNFGDVKEQVINDLGWAISSGYAAGSKAAEYIDSL